MKFYEAGIRLPSERFECASEFNLNSAVQMNHETHEIKLDQCAPVPGNWFTRRVNSLHGRCLLFFVSFRVFRGFNCVF
jgi:hypothetical protein